MSTTHRIVSMNLTKRFAVRSDDAVGQITTLFAPGGDTTEDADEAISCVVGFPDGEWWSVNLREFADGFRH